MLVEWTAKTPQYQVFWIIAPHAQFLQLRCLFGDKFWGSIEPNLNLLNIKKYETKTIHVPSILPSKH